MLLKLKKLLMIFSIWPNIPTAGKEDVVEEIVVDLNTDANEPEGVTIILGHYAPLILAPAEDF
jgi:hypothetical protein